MNAAVTDGQLVVPTFHAGFMITSYLVSFLGSLVALELLQRRTCFHGLINWALHLGAATSFGVVGLWAMQNLGNHAIRMLDGEPEFQIRYNAWVGLATLFLSMAGMAAALVYIGQTEAFPEILILGATAVIMMVAWATHFISQKTILNYDTSYSTGYVFATLLSTALAVALALAMFLHFKIKWTSSFMKRSACALILAASIWGPHWILERGVSYNFIKGTASRSTYSLSRQAEIIVVIALCIGCLACLGVLAFLGWASNKQAARRVPQVVLAGAFFNRGRIMVTPEGLLPCRKITNSPLEKGFDELFDINHALFCWLYRATFCWTAMKDTVPSIREQIKAIRAYLSSQPKPRTRRTNLTSSAEEISHPDPSMLFRLLFLRAANDMASMIRQPLDKVGTLFSGVIDIGTIRKPTRKYWFFRTNNIVHVDEENTDNRVFGRGQALFLVRRVNVEESHELKAAGYRFVPASRVVGLIANSLEITKEETTKHLGKMRSSLEEERALAPGVHLACFIIRPQFQRGLGILVHERAKNVLPATQLPIYKLEPWHLDFLRPMNNLTLTQCFNRIQAGLEGFNERESSFATQLLKGMTDLVEYVGHPLLPEALLLAHPLDAPSGIPGETSPLNPATIIGFRIMIDVHPTRGLRSGFQFQPWRFFAAQQRVYKGFPHQGAFVHQMRKDIASLRLENVRKARESMIAKARQSFHRLSYNPLDSAISNQRYVPSSSAVNSIRTGSGIGETGSVEATPGTPVEPLMGMLSFLRTAPRIVPADEMDRVPLDFTTYADRLMEVLVRDRGSERAMVSIGPSF